MVTRSNLRTMYWTLPQVGWQFWKLHLWQHVARCLNLACVSPLLSWLCTTSPAHKLPHGVQMIAHHTAGGCNLRPGDLLASGTLSCEGPLGAGCLQEAT